MAEIPRLMIAAPYSGAGKTTITLALLSAFIKYGLSPVAFKCGPDYIDPMFHREVLGVPSYNLDIFFTDENIVRGLLCQHGAGHDIAVVEGVMGYYDGVDGGEWASSYQLAQKTQTPAVMVLPARGASLSLAALAKGFAEFRKPSGIVGVLLNGCSESFYSRFKETLEKETGLLVLGYLPRLTQCAIRNRHLGLVTPEEITGLKQKLVQLGEQAAGSIDIHKLLKLAEAAQPLQGKLPEVRPVATGGPRIAVARDAAFCFYYADNLALFERLGGEVVFFSPLNDRGLPEGTCGLYLGGGYPELYAGLLGENLAMAAAIGSAVGNGMPVLAECGGFLYLQESLEDSEGCMHPMAGILPGKGYKTSRLQRFGYITLTAQKDNLLCSAGESIPAHEFHYWDSTLPGNVFTAEKLDGRRWECITATDTMFAGFPHLYFYGNPVFAAGFVRAAAAYKNRRYAF